MNNDQMFELMTKMYSEMQEGFKGMKQQLTNVETRVENIETRVENIETRLENVEKDVKEVKHMQIKMEQRLGDKIEALFDAREVQMDTEKQVVQHLECVETKVDRLELRVLRSRFDRDELKEN
ncbi:MAG: hypothetical protein ACRDDX_14515 [Cellulosilyticaceae bacterium]